MTDPRKETSGGQVTPGSSRKGTDRDSAGQNRDNERTSGTNRDFDESGESMNQGHGHPREERGG